MNKFWFFPPESTVFFYKTNSERITKPLVLGFTSIINIILFGNKIKKKKSYA